MVYSRREVARLFKKFEIAHSEIQNFVGEEVLTRFGGRIPRDVWLKTFGRVAGLDLYFTARANK
jgi:tetrahydromethanopterin S-methyltransferase subunit G